MLTKFPYLQFFFCNRVEISTLARQASIRRMNSVSTDARGAVPYLNSSSKADTYCPMAHRLFSCDLTVPLKKRLWSNCVKLQAPNVAVERNTWWVLCKSRSFSVGEAARHNVTSSHSNVTITVCTRLTFCLYGNALNSFFCCKYMNTPQEMKSKTCIMHCTIGTSGSLLLQMRQVMSEVASMEQLKDQRNSLK